MGRLQTRGMFIRIKATQEANAAAVAAEIHKRQTDPFELAKVRLQRRGWVVFTRLGEIHVGQKRFSRQSEVIAFADRIAP